MKRLLAGCMACLVLTSVAWSAPNLRFKKELKVPELQGEELLSVPLDSEVYGATRTDLADLRILDAAGEEIAFILRKAPTKKKRIEKQRWPADKLALAPAADGSLVISFQTDLEKNPLFPHGIQFISPLVNFEHQIKIETSADQEQWKVLVEEGLIFDYSQYMDVRNLSLELLPHERPRGENDLQFYRITIKDVTQEQQSQLLELTRQFRGPDETDRSERVTINRQPFRIDRLEFWHDKVRQDIVGDRKAKYPVEVTRTEQDDKTKQTYLFVRSGLEPLTRFTVDSDQRNFSRTAHVEIPREAPTTKPWQTIGSGPLLRLELRTLKQQALDLDFPEHRSTEFRIAIDNRDSPPLDVTGLLAEGNVYEVVFLASQGGSYRLAYGNARMESPSYDTATLTTALAEGLSPIASTLGVAEEQPLVPEAEEPWWKRLLNNGPAMTALIAVLVLILASGLYRATRRLEAIDSSK